MSDPEQSLFDFFSEPVAESFTPTEPAVAEEPASFEVADAVLENEECESPEVLEVAEEVPELKEFAPLRELKRAVLGWTTLQSPNGLGVNVATRFTKYKADVAAFWSSPQRKVLHPKETMIIEVRRCREECWPDFSRTEEDLLCKLRSLKVEKERIQKSIRETEPELQDRDTLFAEFQLWDYSQSTNMEYKKCCRSITEVEESLYGGTRFQRIAAARVADFLYLAVPAGEVDTAEIVEGWGLIYIHDDMSVEVVKEAEKVGCSDENRLHLVQNIAKATYESLLFANGIRKVADEEVVYTPIPRRRRPVKK